MPRRRFGVEEIKLLLIVDLGTRGGWVVTITPRPRISPMIGPPLPIVQEAGWAPKPVWVQRVEKIFVYLCRESNLDRPVVQPVARHCTDWATRWVSHPKIWESLLTVMRCGTYTTGSLCTRHLDPTGFFCTYGFCHKLGLYVCKQFLALRTFLEGFTRF
jgi:hypothetical protein